MDTKLGSKVAILSDTLKEFFANNMNLVQKPDYLTTFGRFSYRNHKCFNNKHLFPVKVGQIMPANYGQEQRLSYSNAATNAFMQNYLHS